MSDTGSIFNGLFINCEGTSLYNSFTQLATCEGLMKLLTRVVGGLPFDLINDFNVYANDTVTDQFTKGKALGNSIGVVANWRIT